MTIVEKKLYNLRFSGKIDILFTTNKVCITNDKENSNV